MRLLLIGQHEGLGRYQFKDEHNRAALRFEVPSLVYLTAILVRRQYLRPSTPKHQQMTPASKRTRA